MLKNWNHDLVHQLSETSDSLWRMESYLKSSEGCKSCSDIWSTLRKDYEKHVEFMLVEIKRRVGEELFE